MDYQCSSQVVCLNPQLNPCLFSELPNCALSISFCVRDAMARGFYHWLSIVVSGRDLAMLAACWPFLSRNIQTIISWLQESASQVPSYDESNNNKRWLATLLKNKILRCMQTCALCVPGCILNFILWCSNLEAVANTNISLLKVKKSTVRALRTGVWKQNTIRNYWNIRKFYLSHQYYF